MISTGARSLHAHVSRTRGPTSQRQVTSQELPWRPGPGAGPVGSLSRELPQGAPLTCRVTPAAPGDAGGPPTGGHSRAKPQRSHCVSSRRGRGSKDEPSPLPPSSLGMAWPRAVGLLGVVGKGPTERSQSGHEVPLCPPLSLSPGPRGAPPHTTCRACFSLWPPLAKPPPPTLHGHWALKHRPDFSAPLLRRLWGADPEPSNGARPRMRASPGLRAT